MREVELVATLTLECIMHAAIIGVLALVNVVFAISNSTPTVDLGYAQYQGTYDASTNISTFLGIRYAQPPVGMCRLSFGCVIMTDMLPNRRASLACSADTRHCCWYSAGH